VSKLGDLKVFKDNFVIFLSCETPLTRTLVTKIVSKYGAKAVFSPEGTIKASDVQQFLEDLAPHLANPGQSRFRDIIFETARRHSLNGTWTVCDVWPLGLRSFEGNLG